MSGKKSSRKPRKGDWFTIRSAAGGVDLKVESIEKHKNGGHFVTAKNSPYCYDITAIDEAAWVQDGQAIRDQVERNELEGRQHRMRMLDELRHEAIKRSLEIQDLLGIDSWGESKRPHKKMRGAVLIKSSDEAHEEVLAEIKRLKKLESKK